MNEPLQIAIQPGGLVVLTISGSLSRDRLSALNACIVKAKNTIKDTCVQTGKKARVLIDITKFNGIYDVGALEAMALLAKDDSPFVERTASFGGPEAAKIPGEIAAELAQRDNIKIFKNKEEALQWLFSVEKGR